MTGKIIHFGAFPENGEKHTPDFLHLSPEQLKAKLASVNSDDLSHMAHALTIVMSKEQDTGRRMTLHHLEQVFIDEHKRRRGNGEKGITQTAPKEEEGELHREKQTLSALITGLCRYLGLNEKSESFRADVERALTGRSFGHEQAQALATRITYARALVEEGDVIRNESILRRRIEESTKDLTELLDTLTQSGVQQPASVEAHENLDGIRDALDLAHSPELKAYKELEVELKKVAALFLKEGELGMQWVDLMNILSRLSYHPEKIKLGRPLTITAEGDIENAAQTLLIAESLFHENALDDLKKIQTLFADKQLVEKCRRYATKLQDLLSNYPKRE